MCVTVCIPLFAIFLYPISIFFSVPDHLSINPAQGKESSEAGADTVGESMMRGDWQKCRKCTRSFRNPANSQSQNYVLCVGGNS